MGSVSLPEEFLSSPGYTDDGNPEVNMADLEVLSIPWDRSEGLTINLALFALHMLATVSRDVKHSYPGIREDPAYNSRLKGRAYPIRTWGKEMKAPNEPEGVAVEPLRQPANLRVEQEPQHASQGNVFRDQLPRSQRQRGGPANLDPGNPPPFSRQRDQDWSEPSSGDEEEHFRVETGYREPTERAPPEQRSFS